jgi:hypothetical protein
MTFAAETLDVYQPDHGRRRHRAFCEGLKNAIADFTSTGQGLVWSGLVCRCLGSIVTCRIAIKPAAPN